MKNKWVSLTLIGLILSLYSCMPRPKVPLVAPVKSIEYFLPQWEFKESPEKRIEILRFHHTVECRDCATIGHFVIFLLKKEFQKECDMGLLIYRSINSELLENKALMDKYSVLEEDFVINIVNREKESVVHDETPFKLAKDGKDLTPYLRKVFTDGLKSLK